MQLNGWGWYVQEHILEYFAWVLAAKLMHTNIKVLERPETLKLGLYTVHFFEGAGNLLDCFSVTKD